MEAQAEVRLEHRSHKVWNVAEPYQGVERRKRKPVLGLRARDFDAEQSADHMLMTARTPEEGVGLFVTPNIQHIALARHNAEFAMAMQRAQIVVCDGFPVFWYAQLRGLALPGRITGREVIERLLAQPARLTNHRLFLVLDSGETADAVRSWIAAQAPSVAIETVVPPFGFSDDATYCAALADRIRCFGTTLLFLCVGAPRSEMFVHRHRTLLPPCWALCVGQSFKIAMGLTAPPPALMVRLNLEWAWRILLEPRRMLRRYGPTGMGFLASVVRDLRRNPPGRR